MEGNTISESDVFLKVKEILHSIQGLAIAGFSIVDIDRFRTFYDAAEANGKELVITPKQAYLITKLKEVIKVRDDILVYKKRKKRYYEYEEELFNRYNSIDAEEIRDKQKRYILVLQFSDLRELIDIKPSNGSCYIYSSSEPFNEESEIEFNRFINWLDHFVLPIYHIHSSGHIMPLELRSILEEIKPKRVIPIHTEYANMFAKLCLDISNFTLPLKSTPIQI